MFTSFILKILILFKRGTYEISAIGLIMLFGIPSRNSHTRLTEQSTSIIDYTVSTQILF